MSKACCMVNECCALAWWLCAFVHSVLLMCVVRVLCLLSLQIPAYPRRMSLQRIWGRAWSTVLTPSLTPHRPPPLPSPLPPTCPPPIAPTPWALSLALACKGPCTADHGPSPRNPLQVLPCSNTKHTNHYSQICLQGSPWGPEISGHIRQVAF
jgi:hypothetical protein